MFTLSWVPLPGGHSLWPCASSFQKCPGGKRFNFQAPCLQPANSALVEFGHRPFTPPLRAGWSGRLAGLIGDCPTSAFLTFYNFPSPSPLTIDRPASCVCLHCPGVQLDCAPLWQVPQPGTSALDVQRTVHICQVCICLLCPRKEESSGKPRAFAMLRANGKGTQKSHSGVDFTSWGWSLHTNQYYVLRTSGNKPEGIGPSSVAAFELLSSSLYWCCQGQAYVFYVNSLPLQKRKKIYSWAIIYLDFVA